MFQKFTFFDLFAGAGGFGLGFKMADFEHQLSLEKDQWAIDTIKANNHVNAKIIHENIGVFNTTQSIKGITDELKPDVIIGGPPCQGFSAAGPTKDPNDPRNSLFKDFANWVEVLSPSVFVMENVTGILSGKNAKNEKIIDIITQTFRDLGYTINIWQLNAAHYGVPQVRNRVFLVGNKYGDVILPPPPTHYLSKNILQKEITEEYLKPAIKVWEAIGDLPEISACGGEEMMQYTYEPFTEYQEWARQDSSFVYNHVAMNHTKRLVARYEAIQKGLTIDELPENLKVLKRNGDGRISNVHYNSNYRHLKPDSISFTIPASFYSNFIHPFIPRNITSREAARIQSFPDWYIFKGKRTQISSKLLKSQGKESEDALSQYNQIGNAVPPLLAFNIAKTIKQYLQERHNKVILANKFLNESSCNKMNPSVNKVNILLEQN